MLPLHGQGTAAVERRVTGQGLPHIGYRVAMFLLNSRKEGLPSSFHADKGMGWYRVKL